jgi:carboxyl-terminal processing protease
MTPIKLEALVVKIVVVILLVAGAFSFGQYTATTKQVKVPAAAAAALAAQGLSDPALSSDEFAPFWKTWNLLEQKYAGANAASTTEQDKLWGAIKGMVAAQGDPYTVFFPPEEAKIFAQDISGKFEGIGMEVGKKDEYLTVVAPLKNSPAEKAGVLTGDKIIAIDGENVVSVSVDQAIKKIRGPKGTTVKLTVNREGSPKPIDIVVTRDIIDYPTVETEVRIPNATGSSTIATAESGSKLRDGVFVLRLFSFTSESPKLFRSALREFIDSGSHKLILDLRGNPGGYLEAAWDMASWFLPAGKVILKEDFGKDHDERLYKSKGYNVFNEKLQMMILVDGGTASAAEILAGALREHGKAKLVGTKTFGKGSVQELVKITPETSLKVTVARWFTPNGHNLSKDGLVPDYEVKITPEQIKAQQDPQLDKAIELLKAMP